MIAALLIAAASPIEVGRFQAEGTPPAPWQVVRIDRKVPPTRYRVTRVASVTAVEATAVNSMALLAHDDARAASRSAGSSMSLMISPTNSDQPSALIRAMVVAATVSVLHAMSPKSEGSVRAKPSKT